MSTATATPATTAPTAPDATAILAVLQEHADALHDADPQRLRTVSVPDVVRCDLAPPLVQPVLPPAEAEAGMRGRGWPPSTARSRSPSATPSCTPTATWRSSTP